MTNTAKIEHVAATAPQQREHSKTPHLDRVKIPADMRSMSDADLKALADELRQDTINAVSKTGGHLGAGLGVVELTVALHAVFNTPEDKLIWDVGHQCYPHKILTGRRERIHTIRQGGGLSGFTKRAESAYDPFGAAHSSTSISAGLGMAVARDLDQGDNSVICVIGDGAMSAGMAYEAMNNAGAMDSRLIVILNDNDMSISPPVGALSKYLTRMVSSRPYMSTREAVKKFVSRMPSPIKKAAAKAEETARVAFSDSIGGGGTLFEELGFYYIGPIDGHDLDILLPVLRNLRDAEKGPVLLHVVTKKGKGYGPAERAPDKMHGVVKFDVITGDQKKPKSLRPAYTKVFANALVGEAQKDDKIVAITAAMDTGTGLDAFAKEFPMRMFDVGIAEQHAVTFAAGMAAEGYKPFVAIYSTFLQRAYDQIIHDVCIQNLPVRFAMDRAGLVGADGCTHAGSFDIAYLGCLPNIVLMAPSDEAELARMVATAAAYDDGPIAFRYPRGEGPGVDIPENPELLEIGKGRIVYTTAVIPTERSDEGSLESDKAKIPPLRVRNDSKGKGIAILSYGTRLNEALIAATMLEKKGHTVTVADARFAKPLDTALISELATNHSALITIEEGSASGFGSFVLEHMNNKGLLQTCRLQTLHLPDIFQDHDSPDKQYKEAGLMAENIVKAVKKDN